MSEDEYDKLPPIQCNGEDLIIIDETNSIGYTPPPSRNVLRKKAEESLDELRKHCPQEYKELMIRLMKRRQAGP
jgi:hypothetical protein